MKIALVHGYAVGLCIDGFRKPLDYDAGFGAFRPLIDDGTAAVFRWAMPVRRSAPHVINPFAYLSVYRAEKEKAVSRDLQDAFKAFLEREKPDTLVAHSMGVYLTVNHINAHGLPSHVKNLVFVQGDIGAGFDLTDEEVLRRLGKSDLRLHNYYCPWDITLMASMLLNGYIPAGLGRLKRQYVSNRFFPLYRTVNIHRSSMNDMDFVGEILGMLGE